jgi:hypothetical protein
MERHNQTILKVAYNAKNVNLTSNKNLVRMMYNFLL